MTLAFAGPSCPCRTRPSGESIGCRAVAAPRWQRPSNAWGSQGFSPLQTQLYHIGQKKKGQFDKNPPPQSTTSPTVYSWSRPKWSVHLLVRPSGPGVVRRNVALASEVWSHVQNSHPCLPVFPRFPESVAMADDGRAVGASRQSFFLSRRPQVVSRTFFGPATARKSGRTSPTQIAIVESTEFLNFEHRQSVLASVGSYSVAFDGHAYHIRRGWPLFMPDTANTQAHRQVG